MAVPGFYRASEDPNSGIRVCVTNTLWVFPAWVTFYRNWERSFSMVGLLVSILRQSHFSPVWLGTWLSSCWSISTGITGVHLHTPLSREIFLLLSFLLKMSFSPLTFICSSQRHSSPYISVDLFPSSFCSVDRGCTSLSVLGGALSCC